MKYDMFRCLSSLQKNSIKYMHKMIEDHDLRGCHPPALYIIYKNPGLSQDDVAKKLKFHKGAVAKVIKMMLQSGFIKREEDPDDKRKYRLFLTEKGENAIPLLMEGQRKYEETLTKDMTDEQKRVFIALMEKSSYNLSTAVAKKSASDHKETACSLKERRAERRNANREKLEAFREKTHRQGRP